MLLLATLPALLMTSALAPATTGEPDAQGALFQYDASVDLKLEEAGVDRQGDVSVHDIRFTPIAGRDPVKAYVVVPPGRGPFAGILWVHWLGEPATTNRTEFLKE